MVTKKLVLRALAVVMMGVLAQMTAPAAQAANTRFCFDQFCSNSCPRDLISFCQSRCGNPGQCSTGGCHDDAGHYYDYAISCGIQPT